MDRKNNIVIVTNRPLPNKEEKLLFSNFEFIASTRENNKAYLDNLRLPFVNEPSIGTSLLASEYGWIVVSVVPVSEIFAPIWKTQSGIFNSG